MAASALSLFPQRVSIGTVNPDGTVSISAEFYRALTTLFRNFSDVEGDGGGDTFAQFLPASDAAEVVMQPLPVDVASEIVQQRPQLDALAEMIFQTGSGSVGITGGTAGAVLYQSAPNTTSFTAVGTTGQALVSGGSGSPTWTTGALALGANFTTTGGAVTLTATGATNVTLPTTGTLATRAGIETLTNKTINGPDNTLTNIANASLAHSSVTINGSAVSLGASVTVTASTTAAATFDNSGAGAASGTTFDGSTARTISYNTVGAAPAAGSTSIVTVGTLVTLTLSDSSTTIKKDTTAGYLAICGGTATGSNGGSIQLAGSTSADVSAIYYNASNHVFRSMNGGAAGPMQFGTHTGIGAETLTGYITIKDFGGTTRKLAVVS